MDYDIDKIVSEMDFNSNKFNYVNGLMLTNKEIEVLDRYKINYKSCGNLKEVLELIEEVFANEEVDDDDLDLVSSSIQERDYYQNTNK